MSTQIKYITLLLVLIRSVSITGLPAIALPVCFGLLASTQEACLGTEYSFGLCYLILQETCCKQFPIHCVLL